MSDLWNQINEANAENGATGEKHTPVVSVKKTGDTSYEVTVNVGEGVHPNEPGHFFQWVELRANDLYIARVEFSAVITQPIATFVVNKVDHPTTLKLSAIARCNLHGLWRSNVIEI